MNHRTTVASTLRFLAVAIVVDILIGCSTGPPRNKASWTWVQITDVNMVAGEWDGIVKKEHATSPEGMIRLMIRENGTYLFVGQGAERAAVGAGPLEIRDGRLIGNTHRRTITLALYDDRGRSVLVVDSTNRETGERYQGEFTKAE